MEEGEEEEERMSMSRGAEVVVWWIERKGQFHVDYGVFLGGYSGGSNGNFLSLLCLLCFPLLQKL